MSLISLNIGNPTITASSPQTSSISDITAMEDLFMTVRTSSGEIVTPEKAKRCSAVLACMRGISEDLSALPLVLYKRGKDGDERAIDHPLYPLLESTPNEVMTSFEVREHIIFDLMTRGGFYVLKNETTDGVIDNLWPLSAGYVTRQALELFWRYSDPLTNISGTFTADTVWRGSIMSTNGIDGVALTLLAREAIGLLLAAEQQAARLFSYGVQSDLKLETDEQLGADEREQLREAFMKRHAGSNNAWMPIIAEGGLKVGRIGLTAQESQYVEARQFQIEDVARVFRYPEVLLGIGSKGKSSTYASAEQFFQAYVKHTLTPWAVRIEQTIQRDLLLPKERAKYYAQHDFDQLLRGDTAARYQSYEKAIQFGGMSPKDFRKKERLPFAAGLDYYLRPAQYVAVAGSDAAAQNAMVSSIGAPAQNNEPDGDESNALARRVASHIFTKEHKALVGKQQDALIFYTHFAGFVEDLTGADIDGVLAYLEMRRTAADRFSPESKSAAIDELILLCKKDK